MTQYVMTPPTLEIGSASVNILTTEDDLNGANLSIELMADNACSFSVQYDAYGDGTLWLTQGSHTVTSDNLTVSYVGKGITRIVALKTSALSTITVSTRITTSDAQWGVTYQDIRNMTQLTTTEVSNNMIEELISLAGAQLNQDISVRRIEEPIWYIDLYRQNKRDSSNLDFYLLKSWDYFLGDFNDDGVVDTNDVEAWDYDIANRLKTRITVSAIDERGKITFASPIDVGHWVKISYRFMPVSIANPMVKKAVMELASALAYSKIETVGLKKIQLNKLTVERVPIGYKEYFAKYQNTVRQILSRDRFRKQMGDDADADLSLFPTEPRVRTSAGGQFFG